MLYPIELEVQRLFVFRLLLVDGGIIANQPLGSQEGQTKSRPLLAKIGISAEIAHGSCDLLGQLASLGGGSKTA